LSSATVGSHGLDSEPLPVPSPAAASSRNESLSSNYEGSPCPVLASGSSSEMVASDSQLDISDLDGMSVPPVDANANEGDNNVPVDGNGLGMDDDTLDSDADATAITISAAGVEVELLVFDDDLVEPASIGDGPAGDDDNPIVLVHKKQTEFDADSELAGLFEIISISPNRIRCRLCHDQVSELNLGFGSMDGQCRNHLNSKDHKSRHSTMMSHRPVTSYFGASSSGSRPAVRMKSYKCRGFTSNSWTYRVVNDSPGSTDRFKYVAVNPLDLVNDLVYTRNKHQDWVAHPDGDANNPDIPLFRAKSVVGKANGCNGTFVGLSSVYDDSPLDQMCPHCRYIPDKRAFRARLLHYMKRLSEGAPERGMRTPAEAGGFMTMSELVSAYKRQAAEMKALKVAVHRFKKAKQTPRGFLKWYQDGSPKVSLLISLMFTKVCAIVRST
jgi:hypothetical protein